MFWLCCINQEVFDCAIFDSSFWGLLSLFVRFVQCHEITLENVCCSFWCSLRLLIGCSHSYLNRCYEENLNCRWCSGQILGPCLLISLFASLCEFLDLQRMSIRRIPWLESMACLETHWACRSCFEESGSSYSLDRYQVGLVDLWCLEVLSSESCSVWTAHPSSQAGCSAEYYHLHASFSSLDQ